MTATKNEPIVVPVEAQLALIAESTVAMETDTDASNTQLVVAVNDLDREVLEDGIGLPILPNFALSPSLDVTCKVCKQWPRMAVETQCCGATLCSEHAGIECLDCQVTAAAYKTKPSFYLRKQALAFLARCLVCHQRGSWGTMRVTHTANVCYLYLRKHKRDVRTTTVIHDHFPHKDNQTWALFGAKTDKLEIDADDFGTGSWAFCSNTLGERGFIHKAHLESISEEVRDLPTFDAASLLQTLPYDAKAAECALQSLLQTYTSRAEEPPRFPNTIMQIIHSNKAFELESILSVMKRHPDNARIVELGLRCFSFFSYRVSPPDIGEPDIQSEEDFHAWTLEGPNMLTARCDEVVQCVLMGMRAHRLNAKIQCLACEWLYLLGAFHLGDHYAKDSPHPTTPGAIVDNDVLLAIAHHKEDVDVVVAGLRTLEYLLPWSQYRCTQMGSKYRQPATSRSYIALNDFVVDSPSDSVLWTGAGSTLYTVLSSAVEPYLNKEGINWEPYLNILRGAADTKSHQDLVLLADIPSQLKRLCMAHPVESTAFRDVAYSIPCIIGLSKKLQEHAAWRVILLKVEESFISPDLASPQFDEYTWFIYAAAIWAVCHDNNMMNAWVKDTFWLHIIASRPELDTHNYRHVKKWFMEVADQDIIVFSSITLTVEEVCEVYKKKARDKEVDKGIATTPMTKRRRTKQ